MNVIEPKTKEDFDKYYKLRWEVLRKPWNKPVGSETDELENESIHAMIRDKNGEVIAVGRITFNSITEAQIRSMAVSEKYRGKNLGGKLIEYLEQKAKEKGASKVVLNARENAISFYKRNGYNVVEKSYLLFETIQHYLMQKLLKP